MTANAPNSGGLDNTTPLYQVKAGAPHPRTARATGLKTKGRSFRAAFVFLNRRAKCKDPPLVSRHRLANFFTLSRRAVSVRGSDRRRNRAQRNESTLIRSS